MSFDEILTQVCLAVGRLVIFYYLYDLGRTLFDAYLAPGIPLTVYGAKKGSWAIVTGCTDGIGKEFALELARKGMNLLLVSRNSDRLNLVKEEIAKLNPQVEAQCLQMDFTAATPKDYSNLEEVIASMDISMLVNNVGTSHAWPTAVHETSPGEDDNIINVNCLATVHVTKSVLPRLIAHAAQKARPHKRSLILNIGSFAGVVPTPFLATYSGSKAFLSTWTRALAEECDTENYNIDVFNLNAYFVVSSLSKIRRPNFFTPLPGPFVRHTLAHLGRRGGAHEPNCFSVWPSHAISNWAITRLGRESWWIKYNAGMQKKIMKKVAARAGGERKAK